jgi:hypothetical protein
MKYRPRSSRPFAPACHGSTASVVAAADDALRKARRFIRSRVVKYLNKVK